MRSVIEKIDKDFYIDVFLNPKDLQRLVEGDLIGSENYANRSLYYIGVKMEDEEYEKVETKKKT